jgi:hypothetical protein
MDNEANAEPPQSLDMVKTFLSNNLSDHSIFSVEETDSKALIADADVVWGMTSAALIVAHLAGKQVLSFQVARNSIRRSMSNEYLEKFLVIEV